MFQCMKIWKGPVQKCFKGSFEHSNEVYVPIKKDSFPYFNIYELLRKGYAAGISLLLYWGADKSLTRPERKQATATKL